MSQKSALVCLIVILAFSLAAYAQTSTTLANLRTNNTSAPNNFNGTITRTDGVQVTNGLPSVQNFTVSNENIHSLITYPGSSGVDPGMNPRIFLHVQGWFCNPSCGNGHIVLGYSDNDAAHIQAAVDDMRRRGIDGVIVDWYGPTGASSDGNISDQTAQLFRNYADQICANAGNPTPCPFQVGIQADHGRYAGCSDPTTCYVNDMQYVNSTYYGSAHPSGWKHSNGRPIFTNFDINDLVNWNSAVSQLSGINPYYVFEGLSTAQNEQSSSTGTSLQGTDGAFKWISINTTDPNDENISGVDNFYATFNLPLEVGAGYAGFDDKAASWGSNRKMNRKCGQTWLDIIGQINANNYFSSSRQLPYVQLATWDDYEEGSELETGISNCLSSVTGSTTGDTLNMTLTYATPQPDDLSPNTSTYPYDNSITRFDIYYTTQNPSGLSDSQINLTLGCSVADTSSGVRTINLADPSCHFPNGQMWLFVNAVGKPFFQNHVNDSSHAISYTRSAVTLSPGSHDFGSQAVGNSSAASAFTLTNGTSTALSGLSISASGDFSQTNNCGASLAANSSCTINVTFTPTAAGSRPGTLTASYTGGSVSSQLTGTGTTGTVTLTPASKDFGSQNVGTSSAAQAFTLNNGTASALTSLSIASSPSDYSQTNNCGTSLAAGSSCTINVTFIPTQSGSRPGTLSASYNGGSISSSLAGMGTVPTQTDLSDPPSAWSCTDNCAAAVADTSTQHDGSSTKMHYTGGAAFGDAYWSQILPSNYNSLTHFTFDFWGFIDQPSVSQDVEFAVLQLTGTQEYPFQFQCSASSKTWRIWNAAGSGWVNTGISCYPLPANTWTHFTFHFEQANGQLHYQDLAVNGTTSTINLFENPVSNTNAASITLRAKLVGNGTPVPYTLWLDQMTLNGNAVSLSPARNNFGNQNVNTTSSPFAFTLTNSTPNALSSVAVSATGDFAQSNNCGTSLAAGASCTINVTFTPTATGTRTGTLTAGYTGGSQSASLSGTGTSTTDLSDVTWSCVGQCGPSSVGTQNQLDGASAKMQYTGGAGYTDAIWSNPLSGDYSNQSQFTYDIWAMMAQPGLSEAFEFHVIQVVGGSEYPFQMQCSILDTHTWRVYDPPTDSWVDTGVACNAPPANTWVHYTFHFERVGGQLHYQDMAINGTVSTFNVFANPTSNTNPASMTLRVRLVGDSTGDPYAIWVDKVTLQ